MSDVDESYEAALDALVAEGKVVKRDGRYGLPEWGEGHWDKPGPTLDEIPELVEAQRQREERDASIVEQVAADSRVAGRYPVEQGPPRQMLDLFRERRAQAEKEVGAARRRMDRAGKKLAEARQVLATQHAWQRAEQKMGPIHDDSPLTQRQVQQTLDSLVAEGTIVKDGHRYWMPEKGLAALIDDATGATEGLGSNPGDYVDAHKAERDSEAIAEVIADIKNRKVRPARTDDRPVFESSLGLWIDPKVIDATPIYHQAIPRGEVFLYEDHPCIAPPFDEFVIGYRNQHGNVTLMHTTAADSIADRHTAFLDMKWETAQPVDWDRVRWRLITTLWLGGKGGDGRPFPTSGPYYLWRVAVYEDGEPADISWVDVGPKRAADWDMALVTLLDSLYYLACRNVEYVEPRRSRGFARRMQRTGVKVGQIRVFPVGRSTRTPKGEGVPVGGDGPATAVRGHFASYGPKYGKGLLFGKYEGRFYIPAHVRGSSEVGETRNSYVLEGS